jgi:hypothetical protein
MVITPSVVKEVQAQFGCDTLPGAALENEGGQGSANAHWEYRWFQVCRVGAVGRRVSARGRRDRACVRAGVAVLSSLTRTHLVTHAPTHPHTHLTHTHKHTPAQHQGELMVATNLFAVYGKPATMSRITLAFMADTGWYDVDFEQAGFLNWGHKAGCDFVEKTCTDWIAANPAQQLFCTREGYSDTVNTLCTFDGLARAKCENAQFADGCIMKVRACGQASRAARWAQHCRHGGWLCRLGAAPCQRLLPPAGA